MFGNNDCKEIKKILKDMNKEISHIERMVLNKSVNEIDVCVKQLNKYKKEYEEFKEMMDEYKTRTFTLEKYIENTLSQLNTIMANLAIIDNEIIRLLKDIAELKKK